MGFLKEKYKEDQYGQIIIQDWVVSDTFIEWAEEIYNKFGFDQIYIYDTAGTLATSMDYEVWAYEMPKISTIDELEEYILEFNGFQYLGKEFEICVTRHKSESFRYKPKESEDALILKR